MARRRKSDAAALVAAAALWLLADHAYYLWPRGADRAWVEYLLTNAALLAAVLLCRRVSPHPAWAFVVWVCVLNRAQTIVFGAVTWLGGFAWASGREDLGVALVGRDTYAALAALTGAALIVAGSNACRTR